MTDGRNDDDGDDEIGSDQKDGGKNLRFASEEHDLEIIIR